MKQLVNEQGEWVDVMRDSDTVTDTVHVLESFAFTLKYKQSQYVKLKTQLDMKPEHKDRLIQNFIVKKMKKQSGAVIQPGEFDEYYAAFKEMLEL